jgi:hypothetical protein
MEISKNNIIALATNYTKDILKQKIFLKGFQSACNIIREKQEECYNEDFCDEMDKLAQITYMDIDKQIENYEYK